MCTWYRLFYNLLTVISCYAEFRSVSTASTEQREGWGIGVGGVPAPGAELGD